MKCVDLNSQITYLYSSMRYFDKNEHHIDRISPHDVLLLVFEGVLRFNEDGEEIEVGAGRYYVQKRGLKQRGTKPSSSPKYLYVHFDASWGDGENMLAKSGQFDSENLLPLMEKLDRRAHGGYPITACAAVFYEILTKLHSQTSELSMAGKIAEYISQNLDKKLSLELLAKRFHFSKNHIINIFKSEYSATPVEYANSLRLMRAERMLEVTSDSAEKIALDCGFGEYSHFYKLFIRKNGLSPTKWRLKKRINPIRKI